MMRSHTVSLLIVLISLGMAQFVACDAPVEPNEAGPVDILPDTTASDPWVNPTFGLVSINRYTFNVFSHDTVKVDLRIDIPDGRCVALDSLIITRHSTELVEFHALLLESDIDSCDIARLSLNYYDIKVPPPYGSQLTLRNLLADSTYYEQVVNILPYNPAVPKILFSDRSPDWRRNHLTLMDEDGSNLASLPFSLPPRSLYPAQITNDGETIVFPATESYGTFRFIRYHILTLNSDTLPTIPHFLGDVVKVGNELYFNAESIKRLNMVTGEISDVLSSVNSLVYSLSVSSDGRFVAYSDGAYPDGYNVYLADALIGTSEQIVPGIAESISFHQDGMKLLITGGIDEYDPPFTLAEYDISENILDTLNLGFVPTGKVVYQPGNNAIVGVGNIGNSYGLFRISLTDTTITQISQPERTSGIRFDLSKDGTKVVFVQGWGQDPIYGGYIYLANTDGTNFKTIGGPWAYDMIPRFQF